MGHSYGALDCTKLVLCLVCLKSPSRPFSTHSPVRYVITSSTTRVSCSGEKENISSSHNILSICIKLKVKARDILYFYQQMAKKTKSQRCIGLCRHSFRLPNGSLLRVHNFLKELGTCYSNRSK